MVSREEFLQLKSAVQELRSEMRKLQVDVLQRLTVEGVWVITCAYDTFRLIPGDTTLETGGPARSQFVECTTRASAHVRTVWIGVWRVV